VGQAAGRAGVAALALRQAASQGETCRCEFLSLPSGCFPSFSPLAGRRAGRSQPSHAFRIDLAGAFFSIVTKAKSIYES
jgi:hypothetical protein